MLSAGEVDAVIAQKLMGVTLLKKLGITNVRVTGRPNQEFKQDFCFAVQKGNSVLLSILNEGLALTIQDGTQQRLQQKWLGTPFYEAALARPLVYGGDNAFPPYEYLDEKGRPAGFNIDLARALARELGVEISFRLEPWSEIRRKMDDGAIDMATLFYSESRARTADFSVPITATSKAVFAGKDSPRYTGIDSLRGKRISVQNGDIAHDYLLENGFSSELTVTQTPLEALQMLADGEVDFSVGALLQGRYWMKKNEWHHLRALEQPLFVTDYCFAVPSRNAALLGRINEGLIWLKESGEYREIYNEWLGVLEPSVHWEKLRRILLTAGGVLTLTAAVVLWLVLFLQRQVRKKTAELSVANRELDEARIEALNRMRDAVQAKEQIEESKENLRITLNSIGDAVISTDVDGRMVSLNPVAESMIGWTQAEAAGQPLEEVFRIINEETRQTVESPVAEVLQSGSVVALANHTLLLAKDGREIPIVDSGAPIRNADDEITGVVLVFRDQTAERAARQALEQSEIRFKALHNASFGGIVIHDKGLILDCNQGLSEITGYSQQELIGMDGLLLIAEQTRQWVLDHILAGNEEPYEAVGVRKNGQEYPVRLEGRQIPYQGKEVRVVEFRDITERKQAEEALRESRDHLQKMWDNMNAGIALIDAETLQILRVNPALEKISGYTAEELAGRVCHEVFCRAFKNKCPVKDQHLKVEHSERTLIHKDGHAIDIEKTVNVIYINGREAYLETMIDISERKKAESELRRLSTAIEQSPDAVMITDTKGFIQYVNPAFTAISSYAREEAIGQNPRILKSGKQDRSFYSTMWNTLLAGEVWSGEMVNKRKDGSLYTEEATISPVRDAGGTITGYVAIKRDITEELEREQMFRQSQKMDSVGQLAGGVAHDFNNMLQIISGFAELLLHDIPSTSGNYQCANEIKKAANRAADLTRQLLTFSRKLPVEKTKVHLNETIQENKVLLDTLLGESIRIDFQLADDLRPIHADPGQMTQVIMNLAVNARDAMPSGGCLSIATGNVMLSKEEVEAIPDVSPGAFVCLSVKDTGCGMSQEVQDHLFEPFFTTKEVGKGTGLGMAVIYGIVKQNNGWIHVDSKEGQGTCFKVYLPARVDGQAIIHETLKN